MKRGAVAKVYFKVADNVSPEIQFTAKIKTSLRHGEEVDLVRHVGGGQHWWRWTFSQSLAKGKYQICVYGTDRAGNGSAQSARPRSR